MKRLEQAEQIALLEWSKFVQVESETLFDWLHHTPNGGARSAVEGAILKAMGTKPGVPDLCLPIRTANYGAGWWEMKQGTEKPSEAQLAVHARLRRGGHYVGLAWHWHEAASDMLRYLSASDVRVIVRAKL